MRAVTAIFLSVQSTGLRSGLRGGFRTWLRAVYCTVLCVLSSAVPAAGQVTVESKARLFSRGFDNSREESSSDVDRVLFPDSSVQVTLPLTKNGSPITVGYRITSILESQVSFLMRRKLGTIDLSGGLCLGFLNEFPPELVPGLAAGIGIPIGKSFYLSLYGSTSVYISSLFSLSSGSDGIDQNTLGGAFTYAIRGAKVSLSCDGETLRVESAADPLKTNSLTAYEVSIATDTRDFWLDSTTGIGVEIADTEVGASRQRFGAIFAEEVLLFRLKKIEILAGIKASILNFTMKDLKGTKPPKTPYIGVASGVRFTL